MLTISTHPVCLVLVIHSALNCSFPYYKSSCLDILFHVSTTLDFFPPKISPVKMNFIHLFICLSFTSSLYMKLIIKILPLLATKEKLKVLHDVKILHSAVKLSQCMCMLFNFTNYAERTAEATLSFILFTSTHAAAHDI